MRVLFVSFGIIKKLCVGCCFFICYLSYGVAQLHAIVCLLHTLWPSLFNSNSNQSMYGTITGRGYP
jgi:hypothetical protein